MLLDRTETVCQNDAANCRGTAAGPVVAAAVIAPRYGPLEETKAK